MRSEIDQLLVFCKVVKLGSFTRAAEELYLTQPAVSAQVAKLEQRLRVRLVDRLGRRVYPTEAGKLLYSYAEQVERLCAILAEAEQAVAEMEGELTGRVSIASSPTIALHILPPLLGRFKRQHPKVDVALDVGQSKRMIEGLSNNLYDLALLEGPGRAPGVTFEHLIYDELFLTVATDHPWAKRTGQGVTLEELNEETFISFPRGSGVQTAIDRELQRYGAKIAPNMTIDNIEVVKKVVEAGLGVSILSRFVIEDELARGTLVTVPVHGAQFIREFRLGRRKGRYQTRPVRTFVSFFREEIARKYPEASPHPREPLLDGAEEWMDSEE